jgi:catechol-2,3-dioxygenase
MGAVTVVASSEHAAPVEPVRLRISHIGLYVRDLAGMEDFYTRVLGFTVTDRGEVRGRRVVFTSWDPTDHHQILLVEGRPEESGFNHINQISFKVPRLEDVQATWRRIQAEPGVGDIAGTNHGNAWSVYFRDPEGNRLEIFCDSDWYVSQPCVTPLDLSRPADELRREAEVFCRAAPGFRPIAEYQAELAQRIGRRH